MSLEASTRTIFRTLRRSSAFPKYALERRLDIFLMPFLPSFLGRHFGGRARLIAPEFPLLSKLLELPHARSEIPVSGIGARTVNLDYLFLLNGPKPRWLFVELKTDPESNRDKQAAIYRRAKRRTMRRLREDLAFVQSRTTGRNNKAKYQRVLDALDRTRALGRAIELVYLSPAPPPAVSKELHGKPERALRITHLSLAEFAEAHEWTVPARHRELWASVSGLIRSLPWARVRQPK